MAEINQTHKFKKRTFLLYWVGLHFIFEVLQFQIFITLQYDVEAGLSSPYLRTIAFLVLLLIFLIAQMKLLSPYLPKPIHWILFSAAAYFIQFGINRAFSIFIQNYSTLNAYQEMTYILPVVNSINALILGFAQFLVLKEVFKNANRWPIIRAASILVGEFANWLIHGLMLIFFYALFFSSFSFGIFDSLLVLVFENIRPLAAALITGSALAWFIRNPKDDDMLIEVV